MSLHIFLFSIHLRIQFIPVEETHWLISSNQQTTVPITGNILFHYKFNIAGLILL